MTVLYRSANFCFDILRSLYQRPLKYMGQEEWVVLYLNYKGRFPTSHFWLKTALGKRSEASWCLWHGLEALEGPESDFALQRINWEPESSTTKNVPATVAPPNRIINGVV